jgi:hypothetical protein
LSGRYAYEIQNWNDTSSSPLYSTVGQRREGGNLYRPSLHLRIVPQRQVMHYYRATRMKVNPTISLLPRPRPLLPLHQWIKTSRTLLTPSARARQNTNTLQATRKQPELIVWASSKERRVSVSAAELLRWPESHLGRKMGRDGRGNHGI